MTTLPDFAGQFDRYYRIVYEYFFYRGESVDDANDLAAAVIERAITRIRQFDPEKGSMTTWLLTIARNHAINEWKKRKRVMNVSLENVDGSERVRSWNRAPEEDAVHSEERKNLLAELAKLEERERELIALKFGARMTNREIAAFSGYSESNVGVILYRALNRLRTTLANEAETAHD